MLLAGISGLFDDPFRAVVLFAAVAVSLLIAITFHEASHALTALRLGDDTAARLGRVTLNPKRHLDPAGTVMLLIVGFGWGKPVPVNPYRLRTGRTGMAMVSAAGPMANVALAVAFALLFRVGLFDGGFTRAELQALSPMAWASLIAWYGVALNLLLAVFNLLPLPPLDGGGIIQGIAPRSWWPAVRQLQRYGPIALVALIALTLVTDVDPLGYVFRPVYAVAAALSGV